MGIYHLHLQNISRSSGRSATGSAAYRSGQALRSAAYRSGGELRDDDEILHDYRAKSDVVHSEIILTEGAPKEFEDRQTLWNFADAKEKRKDARLAKEINVALPAEFDLDEQIEVLHEYGYVLNLSYKKRAVYTGIKKTVTSHGNNRNKMPTLQQQQN